MHSNIMSIMIELKKIALGITAEAMRRRRVVRTTFMLRNQSRLLIPGGELEAVAGPQQSRPREQGSTAPVENPPNTIVTRRSVLRAGLSSGALLASPALLLAATEPVIEPQPYFASVNRTVDGLRRLGEPLTPEDEARIRLLGQSAHSGRVEETERILSKYVLLGVRLGKNGVGRTTLGAASRTLVEQGWRSFLVRIVNPFGQQISLGLVSDAGFTEGQLRHRPKQDLAKFPSNNVEVLKEFFGYPSDYTKRWLGIRFYIGPSTSESLTGLNVEYRILQLFSRDRGTKTAYLMLAPGDAAMFAWATEMRTGFWTTFECRPSRDVLLDIKDSDRAGCTASLIVRDDAGRLYPAPAQRIAPDFDFQPQVYRANGETLRLPSGRYTVETWRGPEYLRRIQEFQLDSAETQPKLSVDLARWINAAELGWYPGDPHVHAAGCAHYSVPTLGVGPETMIRHVRGEALAVGDILTWAAGFYHQKQFFTGHVYVPKDVLEEPEYQVANHTTLKPAAAAHDKDSLVRYDLEVSGFPSSPCGHLVLLRLREQDYPGTQVIADWPSWTLPILRWAKAQGAVAGYGHCGVGMAVDSQDLPNYEIPQFDSVGANEYIVALAHGLADFVAGVEVPPVLELNCWYHTLNCGFRGAMIGESDYPCFFDERIGVGRTYVGLDQPPIGDAGYSQWVDGIRKGRLYFGDGRSHFIDLRINNHPLGGSDVELDKPGTVTLTVRVAARLEEQPLSTAELPPWHLERSRINNSRNVLVEVIANGRPIAQRGLTADGLLHDLSVSLNIERSSWVALRILPSGHTHPIFVSIRDKPIRASKRSAQWCLDSIDSLWREKHGNMKRGEVPAARAAYDQAQVIYGRILSECSEA
jgi:hypothetical protein